MSPIASKRMDPEDEEIWISILNRALEQHSRSDIVEDGTPHPSVDDFMEFVRSALLGGIERSVGVAMELEGVLEQRGRDYGEEVLVVMGESGIAEFVKVKVWRLLGGIQEGNPPGSRRDSWVDIAGYAILQLALTEWLKEQGRQS